MKVEINTDRLQKGIARYRAARLPRERRELTQRVTRDVLIETVDLSPVETGKSRAGWLASLRRLSGAMVTNGAENSEREGDLRRFESQDRSEIHATNEVEYINYLEYGTQKIPAFGMARRALLRVAERLRRKG